jgi:cholesterol oxidase
MPDRYEAIVIGTGFGGSINACRLSKKWPGKVLVLERGKEYKMASFPRTPHDMARNFWNIPEEEHPRPRKLRRHTQHGLFDIRNYKNMDVVLAAGLGGGSLIYANVFLEPPDAVFDERWPKTCHKQSLNPYYRIAREVLGSRTTPQDSNDPRRRMVRTELFQKVAHTLGRESKLVDINVFFGDRDLLEPGVQAKNRYGALQTSCIYCAECDIGCNTHSKNTLDLNYLFVARNRYGAEIRTEHLAEKVVPVNARDEDDPAADGSHGYRVYFRNLNAPSASHSELTNRVVVSAGTLGTTELLLRCRDHFGTLPRLSRKLGSQYSGNGDFLMFVLEGEMAANPNYGPVITQRIDFNLFNKFDPKRAFIMEDASYPPLLAWLTEGAKPGVFRLNSLWRWVRHTANRFLRGTTTGSLGYALHDLLGGDLSYNTSVLLCMGIDRSDGEMTLDHQGRIQIDWPYRNDLPLYNAILEAGREFQQTVRARHMFALPTWWWPFRKNVSVHSLGGCVLADSAETGVTSAQLRNFGEAFGYRNLFVADGAIVPTAVGANPTATISALSEMVAEAITAIPPDANL